ncbi:MAG: putative transporter [Polyangiaceae bacterium]
MTWLIQLFASHGMAQAILALALVASLGLFIGRLKVGGISLGIAGTLFSGILLGHLGLRIDHHVLEFAREFGLVLFVYTVGMQVGPGFFDSLKRQGAAMNLLAALIVFSGVGVAVAAIFLLKLPVPAVVGLLSGAVTNTPSLGAAQQTLELSSRLTPDLAKLPAVGYAVAYPFGVVGIIIVMLAIRFGFRIRPEQEARAYEQELAERTRELDSRSVLVENANLQGRTIKSIPGYETNGVVVTRFLRNGELQVAREDTVLELGDIVHIVGSSEALDNMITVMGRLADRDLRRVNEAIVARHILVTHSKVLGCTIGQLALTERFGVTVARVTRGEFKFTGTRNIRLKLADKLFVVGPEAGIEEAAKLLGNSLKALDHPQVLPAFVGIALGVLLGSVPIHIYGAPVPMKLGIAGGPLVASLVLARLRRIGPLNFYMSAGANLMVRELGIVLFLSCVGLKAGESFVDVLLRGPGLYWMVIGAAITLLPLGLVAFIARRFLKLNYMRLCGLLAGSMTDPPALAFAHTLAASDGPSVAYATVYPLTMLLRVITAQLMVILLFI